MSFLYFDCFSGISGDMLVGSLLDCGVPLDYLRSALSKLPVDMEISCMPKVVQGISATAFDVHPKAVQPLRHMQDIESIISASDLSAWIKDQSLGVFRRLAAAEGTVHGIDPLRIHFHELGAVDTIVDIVGTFLCLEYLGISDVYCSPLPWSRGFVNIDHGCYPLPAPATAILLTGFPCVFVEAEYELVTPTGAALITSIALPLPPNLSFLPEQIAYGAGHNERKDHIPNLLRLIKAHPTYQDKTSELVVVLETEVDDLNPELFSHLYQLFVSHPAVFDFFTSPVFMKKNRPGTLITIIAQPDSQEELANLLMSESGSLGVRYRHQSRVIASRSETTIESPWGTIRVKQAYLPGGNLRCKPEFEDCQAAAVKFGIPLLEVYTVVNKILSQNI